MKRTADFSPLTADFSPLTAAFSPLSVVFNSVGGLVCSSPFKNSKVGTKRHMGSKKAVSKYITTRIPVFKVSPNNKDKFCCHCNHSNTYYDDSF